MRTEKLVLLGLLAATSACPIDRGLPPVDGDEGDTDPVGDTDVVDTGAADDSDPPDTDAVDAPDTGPDTDAPVTLLDACHRARAAYVACYLDYGLHREDIQLAGMCDGFADHAPADAGEQAIFDQYACIAERIAAVDCTVYGALDTLRDALAPCGF